MHTPRIIEISGSVDNRRPAHDRWKTIVTLAQASPGYLLRTLRDDVLVLCAVVLLGTVAAHAQDATWLAAPATGDWNTGTNWTGAAVPTGTATFDASSTTTVIFSSPSTSVGALLFNAAAPTYSFNLSGSSLAITGAGITNNSSNSPIFTVSSVALPLAVLSIHGTAANATIINNNLGETDFVGFTTAGTANITTNSGGVTAFEGQSTGGTATITTNNGGLTVFENTPPDGGGQARLITAAGGIVDISLVMLSGMTAGSIEGAGTYRLGSKTLTVGGNNLSTEVSGTIVDGGFSNATGGSLIKVGTGTLTLSGLNTYSGGTTVSGGMLSVAIDANLGASSGGITLAGGELLTTADGFSTARAIDVSPSLGLNILAATSGTTATYTGVLSDTGALVVGDGTNTGTIVFTGNNTYSGGTTINGVTLQIGNGGTIGTIVGTVTDNGHLAFNRSDVVTLPSNISGAGSLTQIGTGTLILTGANTYAGGTTITQGTLQIGNAGTIGSIVGDVVDNANLAFSHSDDITFSGLVSGTGTLTQIGPGTLTLTNLTNSYSGGTFALGGTLSVANDAELGLSTGGITLQGGELLTTTDGFTTARTVDVNPAGTPNTLAATTGTTATYSGLISDTGALVIGDGTHAGTIVFTGNNSYSGGTTISAGTLQIGNGGSTGSIVGNVLNNASLVVDRSGAVTLPGAIAGTGTLNQVGPGTLVMTGTSTYTGATTVAAGTLEVDGALGNTAMSVQSGATLSGKGTIAGGVTIQDGGHLAPGPGAQTLGVGDLSLSSGSILDYVLSTPGVIGGGINTLVNVGGNLTLAGILNVTNGGSFGAGAYRLINYSGALSGTTLTLGSLPVGFTEVVTTAVPGQVNLVVSASGGPTQFWNGGTTVADGTVHGGDGTWDNFTTNFTNPGGTASQSWQNGIAIFSATAGTVTLGADIVFQGMQFMIDGYTIAGSGAFGLHPTGIAVITTDPGLGATIAAPIVGTGGLNKAGLGLLTLTGSNTYTGGTMIAAGTLQIGHGGTTGSIVGDVVDNANLAFSHSDDITFSGLVSGTGTLTQIGPGTLTLTNLTNSYSGGTFALGGTLSVANDAELGLSTGGITLQGGELLTTTDGFTTARTVDVNPAGSPNTLAAAANTTATYTGPISDTGALTIGDATHTGTVVFTGTKSYSGGTIINFGTLQLGNVTTTGSIAGPVFNSGIFNLFNANTAALTTISNNPGATTNFFSSTTASTATIINNGGFTVFIGSSTAGNAAITNNNSGQTTFNTGSTAGNATITTNSGGSTSFHGNSTAGNATINTSGGLTQFFDTSTGGQARFITSVGGIFDISQLTSTGMTVGSIEGAGTYQLGSKMLTVGLNNLSTEVSGRIVDGGLGSGTGGALIKVGTGTLTLTGANTFSGGTIVDSGNLIVDNAQALGTGDLIVNGGVLSADPQTINVLRNYTQNAGGTLQLNIAGRAAGQFDVLNVSGNAALDGTLRLVNLGYQPQSGDKLRLVTTGGAVSGRFAQFQNPFTLAAGFNTIDLVYARQSVTLEFLTLNTPVVPVPPSPPVVVMTTDFSSFAFTPNQLAAASLLDAVQLDPRAVKLISFLNTEPFANLPNDFQKISPDGLTAFYEISFSNANIQKLTLEGRLDDLHNGSNGFSSNMKVNGATLNDQATDGKASKAVIEPIMQHTPENRWGVWVTGFGDFVNVDGDGNAQGYNFTTGGFSVGLDYRIIDQLAIGVFGDYSHTWTSLNPSGHIDVDSGRGGLYATWFNHGIYLNAAIYGGHNSYDSGRAGLGGLANGSTDGAEWSTFITGGYDFRFGPLTVGPIASLQYTDVGIDSFSEKGSLAPLDIHSGSAESLRSDVGFRAFYQWQIGKVVIEPSLKAAWEHEYKYSALPVTAGFAGIPGPSATFFGPSEGHDSAVVSAGVSVQLTPAISTYINYDGQVGRGNYDSNAVTGGVRISF